MVEIENRRSIREYLPDKIDESKIELLLESAMLAPSGNNAQPWHFIIVDNEEMKKKVSEVSGRQKWMESAAVFIVCVADLNVRIRDSGDVNIDEDSSQFEVKQIIRDTSIATEHIVLEATSIGLGTCWVSEFKQDEIRKVLGIPENKYVVTVLVIGNPAENPGKRPRKPVDEVVHRNKW